MYVNTRNARHGLVVDCPRDSQQLVVKECLSCSCAARKVSLHLWMPIFLQEWSRQIVVYRFGSVVSCEIVRGNNIPQDIETVNISSGCAVPSSALSCVPPFVCLFAVTVNEPSKWVAMHHKSQLLYPMKMETPRYSPMGMILPANSVPNHHPPRLPTRPHRQRPRNNNRYPPRAESNHHNKGRWNLINRSQKYRPQIWAIIRRGLPPATKP